MTLGPFRQLNFLRVLPLLCKTDLTQIAIAALSLASSPRPFLNLRVFLTDLIHLQNRSACFITTYVFSFFLKENRYGYQPSNKDPR
jgi:hypothetical protein